MKQPLDSKCEILSEKKSFGWKYGQDLKKLNFMENDHTKHRKPSWNKGPKQANKQLNGHTDIFFQG